MSLSRKYLPDGGYIKDDIIYDDKGEYKAELCDIDTEISGDDYEDIPITGFHRGYCMYRINWHSYYIGRDGEYRYVNGPPISRILDWRIERVKIDDYYEDVIMWGLKGIPRYLDHANMRMVYAGIKGGNWVTTSTKDGLDRISWRDGMCLRSAGCDLYTVPPRWY